MSVMVACQACRKEIHKTAFDCPQCGAPQAASKRYKDKTAAALLAIFLGGFGAHRFYLGKWWGVFYLLFFWTAIPGLIAFVEGIVFVCTDNAKWDDRYNEGRHYGSGSGAGVVVVVVASIFIGIAMIGILAAVAIPAYQQYVSRAKIAMAVTMAHEAAVQVGTYMQENHAVPSSLQLAGFNAPLPRSVRHIAVDPHSGLIRVTMGEGPEEGKAFVLRPAGTSEAGVQWQCESEDIPRALLPPSCR